MWRVSTDSPDDDVATVGQAPGARLLPLLAKA
jgi:hypothetical protein